MRRSTVFLFLLSIVASAGARAVTCPTTGKPNCGPCRVLTCDTAEGFWWCDPGPKVGVACNDNNACPSNDVCSGGTCQGTAVVCPSNGDQCHTASTCNTVTGVCDPPVTKANGSACNDGNACTQGETCQSGICGSPAVTVTCT